MTTKFTAFEALEYALNVDIQAKAMSAESPKDEELGFECFVIARCFAMLGLNNENAHELPKKVADYIRPLFIKGIHTAQLAEIAPDIAAILLEYLNFDEIEQKALVMASIQITTAAVSLMQSHANIEKWAEAVHKMHVFHAFDADFSIKRCFENTSSMPPAFKTWSTRPDAVVQSGDIRLDSMLNALRRYQNGESEWFSTWLRTIPDSFEWNSDVQKFELFWRVIAWEEAGSLEHAIEMLHQVMSFGEAKPQFWVLMAELCIKMRRYGQAEHALEQALSASIEIPMGIHLSIWKNAILQTRFALGEAALNSAKAAHDIEEALLELAMRHGNDKTVAEAVLCAYDAQIQNDLSMIEALCRHSEARAIFIETLAERRDLERVEAIYDLCLKLQKKLPNASEWILLETISLLDNPHVAAQTLAKALRNLPKDHRLYWCAVDLWLELMTSMGALDEAIYGVVEAFGENHPRASRALMFLMARMPRSALGMMQTIMVENLGKEAALQAFERIKQGNASREIDSESAHLHAGRFEQSLWLLPLEWQIQFHAARLNPPPTFEEQAKAARRESVLMARGLLRKRCDPAPEPGQWIHKSVAKASDAFDV